jgi:hypothetical protein
MAIRIPVVISQHERRSGSVADYEEQLITRLILENGLDATLIADLKSIELDTTDHLCIEGLKGDFALATWESVSYVCTHLHRLGIPSIEIIPVDGGVRTASALDSTLPAKKIFLVSLATTTPVDTTIRTLRELRESRSTPVFSIGIPASKNKPNPIPLSQSGDPLVAPDSRAAILTNKLGTATNALVEPGVRLPLPTNANHEDDDFPNIDQLMIDLDQFEL